MKENRARWLTGCVLTVYSVILIRLVVFKAIPTLQIGHMRLRFAGTHTGPGNLVPFRTIGPLLLGRGNHLIAAVNLLGNILPFMPVGLLAAVLLRSMTWRSALVLGVATGFLMEALELIFRVGIFDVDDIILNALGVVLGYGVYVLFKR